MRSTKWAPFLVAALCVACLTLPARADESEDEGYSGEPEVAAEIFAEAEALREEGKWDAAATKYWEALEADLRHFRAHVRYQEAALKAGDSKERMIEDYKSFIEDYPKLFDMKLHLLRLTHDPADRVTALEELRKERKKNANLAVELGRAHLAESDPAGAIEPLTAALELCPKTRIDVPLLLASAEAAAGKAKAARDRLEGLIKADAGLFEAHLALARLDLSAGDNKKALDRAEKVLALKPTLVAAFLIKAEALRRLEERQKCLATLVAARRAAPEDNSVRLAYADALGEEEEGYEPALALYADVLEKDEENLHALFGAGWILERQEKWEAAEEKYREVVGIEPAELAAINSVGYCLFKQGRVSDAQIQFKKAADLDPEFASAVLNLGATYDVQAKYPEAIKVYEGFLKDHPKSLRALVNCAFDYESLGEFAKALKLLMDAHEIQPDDALVVIWIGDNHYFEKRWKDAVKWYEKATTLDEKSFFAWRGLGYALANLKRWQDAVKALEKAKTLDENDLDVYLALGDIYMNEIEDLEKALEAYQEYVQRGGNEPQITDLIVELRKKLKK